MEPFPYGLRPRKVRRHRRPHAAGKGDHGESVVFPRGRRYRPRLRRQSVFRFRSGVQRGMPGNESAPPEDPDASMPEYDLGEWFLLAVVSVLVPFGAYMGMRVLPGTLAGLAVPTIRYAVLRLAIFCQRLIQRHLHGKASVHRKLWRPLVDGAPRRCRRGYEAVPVGLKAGTALSLATPAVDVGLLAASSSGRCGIVRRRCFPVGNGRESPPPATVPALWVIAMGRPVWHTPEIAPYRRGLPSHRGNTWLRRKYMGRRFPALIGNPASNA